MSNPEGAISEAFAVDVEFAGLEAPAAGAPLDEGAAMALKVPMIVIDGTSFDASNLTEAARGAVASLQFADARLMALYNELAICQTAYFAYGKGVKADLERKAN